MSGEGHSRLYSSSDLYELAVAHTLETTTPEPTMPTFRDYQGPPANQPFYLPWAMRGVLEEELVKTELADECGHLLNLFEEWRPTNKKLQDVRFRLEALKSKL
jgi:hypothetical protein